MEDQIGAQEQYLLQKSYSRTVFYFSFMRKVIHWKYFLLNANLIFQYKLIFDWIWKCLLWMKQEVGDDLSVCFLE